MRMSPMVAGVALAALLALLCVGEVPGIWIGVPLEELVWESDLIVVGYLRGVVERRRDYGKANLVVEEVLWGRDVPRELTVKWGYDIVMASGCAERSRADGERMIWLLTRGRTRNMAFARHPGRRRPLEQRDDVLRALKAWPVFARSTGRGRRSHFELVFRNTTANPVEIPRLAISRGRLELSPEVRLVLTKRLEDSTEIEVPPLPGMIRGDWDKSRVTVAPRSEYKLTFKPSRIYRLGKGTVYRLTFEIDGFPSAKEVNRVGLYEPIRKKAKRPPARPRRRSSVS